MGYIIEGAIFIAIFVLSWKGLMKIRKKRMKEYKEIFGKKDKE